MEPIEYRYTFLFPSGRKEEFVIKLHGSTLEPAALEPAPLPDWTKLDFKQCPNCTLSLKITHCPLAARLAPVVERMGDVTSYEDVEVRVTLDERSVTRSLTAQEGISAMMGVITATSGCPHMVFFKPMARFHLPFANIEETYYRAASMYMLAQYYRWQSELGVDLDLKGLHHFYGEVAKVNKGIAERLRSERREDGTINALVLLDMFVKSLPLTIDDVLAQLKPLFEPYLKLSQNQIL
ncbi:MAG TPA: hypothetical protein VGE50_07900 [Gammaproteobacteria bacterium]